MGGPAIRRSYVFDSSGRLLSGAMIEMLGGDSFCYAQGKSNHGDREIDHRKGEEKEKEITRHTKNHRL